ncbi:hypothetical protein McanMca71_006184 [Microsporum canis]
MAYDGYRSSFDAPGFNPNTTSSTSNNYGANSNGSSVNSNINSNNRPNAAYPGFLQPSYGEYPVEQDTPPAALPPPPPPPLPQPQPQQAPYQGTDYHEQSTFYPPPTGHLPQHGDALKQPFSTTAPRPGPVQQPPPPPVPDPNYPSPDLIAQVTAAVIQQLRAANTVNVPPPPPPPQHPSQQGYQPPTPALSSSSYNRQSPNPNALSPSVTTSPNIPLPPPNSGQPDLSNAPTQSTYPPPIPSKVDGNAYNSSKAQNHDSAHPPPTSPGVEKARGSSFGLFNSAQEGNTRSKGPSKLSTATDETTLEKIWGTLFDKDDLPTSRTGQLLRGIALHMIENYPPGNTLVITSEKMQKFYSDHSVPSDTYPWQDIFDNRTSSISRLYRSLGIEHHLIQNELDERPDLPGLTPRGFERWMSMMIQAHPEREFERLQCVVQNMPISNPDDKKERFPKEIPRRLFPKLADYDIKETLDRWIITHCHVELMQGMLGGPGIRHPRAKSSVDNTSTGLPSRPGSTDIRHKQFPPPATVEDAPDEDDDHVIVASANTEAPPVQPIERERKPYSMSGWSKGHREDTSPHPTTSTTASTSSRHPDTSSGVNSNRKQHVVVYDADDDNDLLSSRSDIDSKYSTSHHGHAHAHPHSHSHGHSNTYDDSKRHHGRDRDRDRDLDWEGDRDRGRRSWGSDEEFYRSPTSDRDKGRRRGESRGHLSNYDKFWEYQ